MKRQCNRNDRVLLSTAWTKQARRKTEGTITIEITPAVFWFSEAGVQFLRVLAPKVISISDVGGVVTG